jgi:hypothetical protein
MTWHTHIGDRILDGIEAEVYLTAMQIAIDSLQDAIESDDEFEIKTYDRMFDLASFDQKVVLLHTCLSALLQPDVEIPELSNVLEAAAYFPFAFLRHQVEEEIVLSQDGWFEADQEGLQYFYRHLLWKAFEEYVLPVWKNSEEEEPDSGDGDEVTFDNRTDDPEFWDEIVEELIERIFWDRDWMVTWTNPQVLDGIEPEASKPLDLDDYFTNRLPKVSIEESEKALAEIRTWKLNSNQKK